MWCRYSIQMMPWWLSERLNECGNSIETGRSPNDQSSLNAQRDQVVFPENSIGPFSAEQTLTDWWFQTILEDMTVLGNMNVLYVHCLKMNNSGH